MSTHNFVSCIASLTICLSSLFCLVEKESVPNFLSIHFFPYQNTNRQPSKGIPSLHGKSHAHLKNSHISLLPPHPPLVLEAPAKT